MIEKLIAAVWNRLAASNKSTAEQGSGLDLGFQIMDGEVLRRRAHLPQSKRAEHLAILGKTGQGKSFFLRHLAGQDVQRGQGFVFFDLHGDTMPFLLRLVAAEERKRGVDLSEKLIVIEPGDALRARLAGDGKCSGSPHPWQRRGKLDRHKQFAFFNRPLQHLSKHKPNLYTEQSDCWCLCCRPILVL
jgi:hypothetical protein